MQLPPGALFIPVEISRAPARGALDVETLCLPQAILPPNGLAVVFADFRVLVLLEDGVHIRQQRRQVWQAL